MLPLTLTVTILTLSSVARANTPVERLDELINGLSDDCICDPSCTAIVDTECTDIQCACNLQLQAQQCVMKCERTSAAVVLFNTYLDSCVEESLAIPTATLPVVGITSSISSEVADVQTQVQYSSQAVSTRGSEGGMGYDRAGDGGGGGAAQPGSSSDIGANWLEVGSADVGGSSTPLTTIEVAGYASGAASASGLSLTHYNPAGASGVNTASGASSTGITSPTAALKATNSYFSQAVSEDCQTPCQCWKDAADACTDDICLCTPDAFKYARECNECVGSSRAGLNARNVGDIPGLPWSRGDSEEDTTGSAQAGAQGGTGGSTGSSMGFHYSEFTEACQAKVPGIANGAVGLQQDTGGVEIVATGGVGSGNGNGWGGGSAVGGGSGGQPIMITDASGRTQYAGGAGGAVGVGAAYAYSTNTVTATAAGVYGQETVVVDGGGFTDGAFGRQVITWELLLVCVSLSLMIM